MKYESPITYHAYHSKYMAKVKVFEKWVKFQGQKVKNVLVPIESSCHKEHTYEI
jgi:hypothetical protein